ncbi:MAG: PH domain-containing protein [Candidatus Poseidoniaceae archaeon]|jgi:hypothetical protein|nr:PH domain-containing protein [Candidatus Poseidoniaceae archaeon]
MSEDELSEVEETQGIENGGNIDSMGIDNAEHKQVKDESLSSKFRLTPDEEILKDVKPSIFAFVPMYILALLIFAVHWLFDWGEALKPDEPGIIADILFFLLDISKVGDIGFVLVMLGITWFNRMMNGTTSGRWTTLFLVMVSLTPIVIELDDILVTLFTDRDSGFIPFGYSYTIFGIGWSALFVLCTMFYQRSFHYAITNHRVIFTQHLIIPGDGRRILFDNINEIRTQRTLLGAIFGYNTIICDTGSSLGISEESMSVSTGAAGSGSSGDPSTDGQNGPGFFKRMFAFLTYQRTRKFDTPDPKFSFYCITGWKDIEQLLNEMHQRHSQSGILTDLKEQMISNLE